METIIQCCLYGDHLGYQKTSDQNLQSFGVTLQMQESVER